MNELQCQVCQSTFTARRHDARYCSVNCRQRAFIGRARQGQGPDSTRDALVTENTELRARVAELEAQVAAQEGGKKKGKKAKCAECKELTEELDLIEDALERSRAETAQVRQERDFAETKPARIMKDLRHQHCEIQEDADREARKAGRPPRRLELPYVLMLNSYDNPDWRVEDQEGNWYWPSYAGECAHCATVLPKKGHTACPECDERVHADCPPCWNFTAAVEAKTVEYYEELYRSGEPLWFPTS